mmetsp:Transcript_73346/g.185212  ORF Transcript_73346/g.185212 Transcript_73346/m.185212 type:complete len:94 (+) Transcript_73346:107-388(+)
MHCICFACVVRNTCCLDREQSAQQRGPHLPSLGKVGIVWLGLGDYFQLGDLHGPMWLWLFFQGGYGYSFKARYAHFQDHLTVLEQSSAHVLRF